MGDEQRFLELVTSNPVNREIVARLPELELPDCQLVAGCLFQTVWNGLAGNDPTANILDYDVFYFDAADTSWEAEDVVIRRCAAAFADLDAEIQVRNQARVHLWYGQKFHIACAPLRSSRDGIDHFLNQSSCFGILPSADGKQRIYAPFGFHDLFEMVVRPNRRRWLPDVYYQKAERWRQAWPDLTIVPWAA